LKFGTWNVKGCRNKIEEIIREINIMKMDVVVLTETKKKEQEMKHWKIMNLFSGGKKYDRAKRGVPILIIRNGKVA
jgi:exonuclease III